MRQWIGRAQTPLNATNPILEPNKKKFHESARLRNLDYVIDLQFITYQELHLGGQQHIVHNLYQCNING